MIKRGKPPFPQTLMDKKCTENIKGLYNRPMGDACEIRHRLNKDGTLKENEWSCIGCHAVFFRVSRNAIKKRYKVQVQADKVI